MIRKLTTTTTTVFQVPFTLADLHGSSALMCDKPGCKAETVVYFSPALALNGGKCVMNVSFAQTDFDDDLGVPEKVDWLVVEGTNLTLKMQKDSRAPKYMKQAPSQHGPGKNPCTMRYMNQTVTAKDQKFVALLNEDVTKLATLSKPLGALRVSSKISEQVDECGYKDNKWLLYADVEVTGTPPAKFVAKPPSLTDMTLHTPLAHKSDVLKQ